MSGDDAVGESVEPAADERVDAIVGGDGPPVVGELTGEVAVAVPVPVPGLGSGPPGGSWPPRSTHGARAVAIANDAGRVVERSVATLAELPDDLPRHALVGGLAVMVRLYEAHRVTTDFDEVSQQPGTTVATLVALGARRTTNGVELPDRGVRLDLLDAETSLADLDALVDDLTTDDERRAWQLAAACRYALETASSTDILVVEREQVVARVSLPVAVAGALVALKVHAAVAPDRPADKAAADVFDAWRLARTWGPSVVAEDLSRAPVAMLRTTAAQLQQLFGDDVDRTAHRLRRASVPGVEAVGVDDLEAALVLVDYLAPFLHWDAPAGS